MGLPSGQQVARLMGVKPLTNDQLWKNHRIEVKIPIDSSGSFANVVQVLREFDVDNQDLKALFADPGWNGEAPLWFYILKEAELVGDGTPEGKGRTLGPVGGRIVAEVLVGLLQRDPNSYLYLDSAWKPQLPIAREKGKGRTLGPVGGRIVAEVLVGLLQKDPNSYLYLQPNWKPQLPMARVKGTFTMADLLMYAGVWS